MIHQYKLSGYNIVLDVYSGSVHAVDDVAYDAIALIDQGSSREQAAAALAKKYADRADVTAADISDVLDDIDELTAAGQLFAPDAYADHAFDFKNRSNVVKALCLHVAHSCNLNCSYCFAGQGKYHGESALMPLEVGKRALDFLVENSGSHTNLEVDFFGGEPLMAMDTVKETVKYARSIEGEKGKAFRFTMTTNGVLLNQENIDYINEEMSNCVLSLDGRPEVNDRHRPTVAGTGSYDVIVPKFKKLVETRGDQDYYLRGTFTRDNLDFAADVIHIASEGFESVSVEPAVGKPDDPFAVREEDLPQVKAEYDKLARYLLDHPEVNFFHFNVDLAQGPCVIKRMRGCGAGCEYVCITPDGDIYPCHQFVGNEEFKLGNVYDDTFDMELSSRFAGMNIYTRKECGNCWAKFYCSGGCSAANYNTNGDITQPSHVGCEMERKRLECAIAIKAIRSGLAD